METSDISNQLRWNLGATLAAFDRAMVGFDHPAAHRRHHWSLPRLEQHRPALELVEHPKQRRLLRWAMDEYTNSVSGILPGLPAQFIHGDANPENILVRGDQVVGLLDFGDSGHNPTVCELAICLAYQFMEPVGLGRVAEDLIGGYESVRPLSPRERGALLPLAIGRLANTLCVATVRRRVDPANENWFVSERKAWSLLGRLAQGEITSL